MTGQARRPSWPGLRSPLLVGALLVLALGFLGTRGLWEPDEGRYVEVAREMVLSGNYLVPTLNQVPHFTKPPLTYWTIAAGLYLAGWNEWGARLYLAIAFLGTAWVTARLGARLWDEQTGRWAGLIYATMLLPFVAASIVTTDTLLTLWVTMALACFWRAWSAEPEEPVRGWIVGYWAALGAAFLTKGPPGLLPVLVVAAFLGLVRRRPGRVGWRPWLGAPGLVVFLLLALPWFLTLAITHEGLAAYLLRKEGFDRIFTSTHNRNNRWYMAAVVYAPTLLLGAMPWLLAVPIRRRPSHDPREPRHVFLALWILMPAAVLCLASSRLPLYLLPVFPPLALAIAGARRPEAGRPRMTPGRARRTWALVGLWMVALLAARLGAASLPSDTRALAGWIRPHLGPGPGELVVIDQQVYGLPFYLDAPVELVTSRLHGSPQYWMLEPWATEVAELATTPRRHLFLVREKTLETFRHALTAAGPTDCREVATRARRHLITCDPAPDSSPRRLAVQLERRTTAGGRFRIMDDLRELDETSGLDRVVVFRSARGAPSRVLDPYVTWPLESRGVAVDVFAAETGLVRTGAGARLVPPGGVTAPIGRGEPALAEIAYPTAGRSPLVASEGARSSAAAWRVLVLAHCADSSEETAGSWALGPSSVITLCVSERRVPDATPELRVAVHPHGTADSVIVLTPEDLGERVLLLEFTPARIDVVLQAAGHPTGDSQGRRLLSRRWAPGPPAGG